MIDSHCHLDFKQFDGRRDQVIADANAAGVHTIINIGVDLETSRRSVELAEEYDCVFATVGVHPHDARTMTDAALAELRGMARHERVKAIGEIGLDFYRTLSPRDTQQAVFRRQLELAVEMKMPVVIHTRQAMRETIEIIRDYASRLPGGVFHCFPGDDRDAFEVIEMGFAVAVGGTITFPNSRMARMATAAPLDKILLETDAPFLAPEPYRGKTNQPAYIPYVCRQLAKLKQIPTSEVEKITDRNCQKLFRLVDVLGE